MAENTVVTALDAPDELGYPETADVLALASVLLEVASIRTHKTSELVSEAMDECEAILLDRIGTAALAAQDRILD